MSPDVDVVVVGAGALGASVTFHLAALGKKVLLVDRHQPVTQTSLRAAGMAMQVLSDDSLTRISIRSVAQLVRFEELTGQPLTVHRNGSLKVARTEADVGPLQDEISRGHRLGVEIDAVSAAEAQVLTPWLHASSALAIWYAPDDLYLNPADLPRAYLRAAVDRGAVVWENAEVTGLRTAGGVVEAVVTTRGVIDTPSVVITAGAWSRQVGELAGIEVPVWPVRHQLAITAPMPSVHPEHATVRILDARAYCRPEGHGLLFGVYEPEPLDVDPRGEGAGFEIANLKLDRTPLLRMIELVHDQLPILSGARIVEHRGGLPTMTPDGHFIVDRVPEPVGLWVLTGCNVGGLSTSPALGEDLATWITTGERPEDMTAFGLGRFMPGLKDERQLRETCMATYRHKYSPDELLVN